MGVLGWPHLRTDRDGTGASAIGRRARRRMTTDRRRPAACHVRIRPIELEDRRRARAELFSGIARLLTRFASLGNMEMSMRRILFATAALGTLVILDTPSLAQGFRVGPGGLEIDDGRGYREEREDRRYRRMCRELRDRCENKDMYGEEGQGNCRRYRRMCG